MSVTNDIDARLRARAERNRVERRVLREQVLALFTLGVELYAMDVVDALWPGPWTARARAGRYPRVKELLGRLEDAGELEGVLRESPNGPGRRYFRRAEGKAVT